MFIPVDIWFRAFLLTLAIEAPIAIVLLGTWEPSRARLLALVVFANLASHPAVWFIFSQVLDVGTANYVAVVEAWAVGCEALFYLTVIRGLPVRRAVLASVVANAASFVAGLVVVAVWPALSW